MSNRKILMQPSIGTPPVGDLADLVVARLAQEQPIQQPPLQTELMPHDES